MWPARAPVIIVHLSMVFGDKLVDPDISGAGGSNRGSHLVSDEVRTKMMMAIPGVPGEDYPILSSEELPSVISSSQFSCKEKEFGGYFADASAASRCQVFHVCGQSRGVTGHNTFYTFLCPNGTIFNQLYFICDWWFNVNCESSSSPSFLTRPLSLPSARSSVTKLEEDGDGETLIRLDTIYSAIKAANAKYESQHDDNQTISYVDVPSIERSARLTKKVNTLRNRKRRKSRNLKLRVFAP